MVSSYELARGFEHYMIIDIVSLFGAKSRSMAQVITTCSNPVLDMEWIIQNILTPDHDCDEIMNWDKREKVTSFSMSAFIRKSLKNFFLINFCFLHILSLFSGQLNRIKKWLAHYIFNNVFIPFYR